MATRLAMFVLVSLALLPIPVAQDGGVSIGSNVLAEERTTDEEGENAESDDAEPRDADAEKPAEGDADEEDPDDETLEPVRSPDIFVPSEDISEDLEVTFPVDI